MDVMKSSTEGQQTAQIQPKKVKAKSLKNLTVKPIRLQQEAPRQSLNKTIKFKIKADNVEPLDSQVAGHGTDVNQGSNRGMLLYGEGYILKPVQPPPKGVREIEFYQHISTSPLALDRKFYSLIPKFYGTDWMKTEKISQEQFIILENLTQGMEKPCVIDIKIGAKTYGPDVTEAKMKKEDAKYLGTKKPLGYSVTGIITRSQDGEIIRIDRSFGLKLSTDSVMDVLKIFLNQDKNPPNIKLVAQTFLKNLRSYADFFEEQTSYHVFASSLLFVYDFSCLQQSDLDEKLVRLKLIDFAHVFPAKGEKDENFLFGLKNLQKLFEGFIDSL